MSNHLTEGIIVNRLSLKLKACSCLGGLFCMLLLLALASGCKTPRYAAMPEPEAARTNQMVLQEGDSLKISFPGAPNLNTDVRIRLDGIISLPVVRDVKAAGRTPAELEQELLKLYGPQLQTKEVSVSVTSSVLYVYVTGAVLRPGKITSD